MILNFFDISPLKSFLLFTKCFKVESIVKSWILSKDGLTSFLMLSVLEAKVFQYGFLVEHKMCVNNRY